MSLTVKGNHPLAEVIACALFSIETVPVAEQKRMVNRAAKAAVKWHEENKTSGNGCGGNCTCAAKTQNKYLVVYSEFFPKYSLVKTINITCNENIKDIEQELNKHNIEMSQIHNVLYVKDGEIKNIFK